ncbi:SRPBCC family protein [uncultured Roseobacter sp.]|uniref:SRPBCC family protein n=1 Tax=uncultured Roseobacter sp. TaxID=114847 RepID=UPI002603ACD9|nr:SRPBCC family protein [uncultured Roseobacter sp.]
MQITRSMEVAASAEHLWKILAEDYAKVGQWARAVRSSEPNTAVVPLKGATVGGRVCTASIGDVIETIRTFDVENHILAYDAKAKAMPFFVRNLSGRWELHEVGSVTEVDLSFVADLMPPFDVLMGWAIRRQFNTAIDETLEDLKLLAETGKIHPDKAAALAA